MIDTLRRFWKTHREKILCVITIAVLLISIFCINSKGATTDEMFNGRGWYISEVYNGSYGTTYTASSPSSNYLYATRSSAGKRMPTTEEYISGYGTALVTNVPILTDTSSTDEYGNPPVLTSIRNWAFDPYVQYWWEYLGDTSSTSAEANEYTYFCRTPLASLAVRALAPRSLDNPPYAGYQAIPIDVTVYFYDVQYDTSSYYSFEWNVDTEGTPYTTFMNVACRNHTTRNGHDNLLITGIVITPSTRYGNLNSSSVTYNCLQVIAYGDLTMPSLPDTGVGDLNITDSLQLAREIVLSSELAQAYADGRNSSITDNLGITSWLTDAGDAVTSFTLFEVGGTPVTIGTILSVFLGVLTLIFILKLFAGG